MKLVFAEEEEKYQSEEGKKTSAALRIQRVWRRRQVRVIKDINYQVATVLRQSFGKIEAFTLTSIKKCFICKKDNALR